jgi:two-component system, chemotaxis family, chemotaxis protein CheY
MKESGNKSKRILIVDDDASIRALYSKTLRLAGFEVITAQNGKEGAKAAQEFQPDLIILDLVMPEQEGIETLLELQSKYPEIPVIAMSGAIGASEYLHVADLLGARQTLQKPVKPDELIRTVRLTLEKSKGAGSSV